MPWKVQGNCVHKLNPDGSLGPVVKCHDTKAEAEAHRRALYANMPKTERYGEHTESSLIMDVYERYERYEPFNRYEFADKKAKNKPYGDVKYADPKNGKYPIDTEKHVRAAWAYINVPENAAKYPLNGVTVSQVKARIRAAMKKLGISVA